MLKGLGGLGDMAKMMKAAQDMQAKMAELQDDLARVVVIGESGAGLVRARCTAKGEITGLEIDASILVPSEKEVLEDLILWPPSRMRSPAPPSVRPPRCRRWPKVWACPRA